MSFMGSNLRLFEFKYPKGAQDHRWKLPHYGPAYCLARKGGLFFIPDRHKMRFWPGPRRKLGSAL